MKTIKRREDVELLEICGEYLLVATKEARDTCPYVTQINETAADIWNILAKPCTVNDLIDRFVSSSGKEKKDIFLSVLAFVNKLMNNGYLIEEENK